MKDLKAVKDKIRELKKLIPSFLSIGGSWVL